MKNVAVQFQFNSVTKYKQKKEINSSQVEFEPWENLIDIEYENDSWLISNANSISWRNPYAREAMLATFLGHIHIKHHALNQFELDWVKLI